MLSKTVMLVSGCDVNQWVWPYWYKYLSHNWAFNCGIDVVMLGENFHMDIWCGVYRPGVTTYYAIKNSWTKRVKIFLSEHPEVEYIIYAVEDQMILKPVDINEIKRLVRRMRKYNVKYILLRDDKYIHPEVLRNDRSEFNDLIRIHYDYHKVFLLQTSIFERKFFESLIHPGESIWDTEIYGHQRIRDMQEKTYIYVDKEVYKYQEVLRRGKVKPHGAKFLWAIDADEMPHGYDRYLDRHSTGYYYDKWKDKITPKTLEFDYKAWIKEVW